MQKFEQTELKNLQPGDRFYFCGDKKKQIYTLASEKTFFTLKQKNWTKHYASCISDNNPKVSEPHLQERRVIFLRNINQKI